MSFFKNPEFNSLKVLLLLVLIAGSGYFVFSNNTDRSVDQSGKVFFNKKDKAQDSSLESRKIIVWGNTGQCTVVYDNGTWADGISQYDASGNFTGCLLSDGTTVTPGTVGVEDIIEHGGPKEVSIIEESIK